MIQNAMTEKMDCRATCSTRMAHRAAIWAVMLVGMTGPGLAGAQLDFSQQPPMISSMPGAAPNIILSIDDSGSMSQSTDVTRNGKPETRMQVLKNALTEVFSDQVYLGKFRLAFEAMWNNRGFGGNRFFVPVNANEKSADHGKPIDNGMQWFDEGHRQNFLDWVQTLTGTGNLSNGFYSTPSQLMLIYAGEYLKGRVLDGSNKFASMNFTRLGFAPLSAEANPWNARWASASTPADSTRLACRRSYLIFMTDGMWNLDETGDKDFTNGGYIYMPFVSDVSGGHVAADANYDGHRHVLPDGQVYDPAQPYGAIYSDDYPASVSAASQSGYANPLIIENGSIHPRQSLGEKLYFPLCDDRITVNAPPGHSAVSTLDPLGCSSTLSDFALYYWATDLQPGMDDKLTPIMPVTMNQTFSSGARAVSYPPYWNPQNDPATWQHMQTYVIGLGTDAGVDTKTGALLSVGPANDAIHASGFSDHGASGGLMGYGPFFSQYASGARTWPASGADNSGNAYDLLHAAYNGRGKYYAATTQASLTAAFHDILREAMLKTSPDHVASASASSDYLTHGAVTYVASYAYDADKAAGVITGAMGGWSGALTATAVTASTDAAGNAVAHVNGGRLWAASIPASAARRIFTASSAGVGIAFDGASLAGDPSGVSQADVEAVRGNPLGDIVDSQPVFVGQPARLSLDPAYATFVNTARARAGMVYVGANDGMLHGFDAGQGTAADPGTGVERMAYVPRGLLGQLGAFGGPRYAHRHWVNGSAFSGDARIAAPHAASAANPGNWATVLVGTLGAGGPGYFVLDVTDPASLAAPASSAGNLVLIDATDTGSASPLARKTDHHGQPVLDYIGHQFSAPVMDMYTTRQSAQIVPINTTDPKGEWAVIMGNGYNSASGLPVLLVQSLSRTKNYPLYIVPATCTAPTPGACQRAGNGLGAPRPVDVDGSGTADIVYAGDLMGNLWKFDLASPDPDRWNVAYGGQPMFRAVGPTGAAQPVTSAPAAAPHPGRGFMVAVGTGQNLTVADAADTRLNSVYALYDNQAMTSAAAGQMALVTTPPPLPFCPPSGDGGGRYGACLYRQTGGVLDDSGAAHAQHTQDVRVGASSRVADVPIDGQTLRGWYFDIPDIANGNAGKVLTHPVVMSGNTLMFYSQNVAGHPRDAAPAQASAHASAETCDPATPGGAKTTVNFFNLFTGNATGDTLHVHAADLSATYAAGHGNRFQASGAIAYVPNGPDSLSAVGQDTAMIHQPPNPTGRRVGWHVGR